MTPTEAAYADERVRVAFNGENAYWQTAEARAQVIRQRVERALGLAHLGSPLAHPDSGEGEPAQGPSLLG